MQQNLQQHKSRSHHPHITKRYTGGERIGATVIGRWTQHVAYAAFTIRWKPPSIVKHDAGVPCVLSAIAFLYLPLLFFVCHCSFLPTFACSSVYPTRKASGIRTTLCLCSFAGLTSITLCTARSVIRSKVGMLAK